MNLKKWSVRLYTQNSKMQKCRKTTTYQEIVTCNSGFSIMRVENCVVKRKHLNLNMYTYKYV